MVVFFAFIPFFAVRELRRVLGEGVIRIFFHRESAAESGRDTTEDVRKVTAVDR